MSHNPLPVHLIEITSRQKAMAVDYQAMRGIVSQMLSRLGYSRAEISIQLVDNSSIASLNQSRLGHEGATDIITFPLSPPDAKVLEGELVISAEWAKETAQANGDSLHDELALYLAHGLLHLAGLDDIAPADAREMRLREFQLLTSLGITPPKNRFGEWQE
ncbi:MAG: rRNA maturation RNase YbeY [bacterium]